jgi:hypothetical protein
MKFATCFSRIRSNDWCTFLCISATIPIVQKREAVAYISRVHLALNDVQNRDVACGLAGRGRDHAIIWLKQPAHDIQNSRPPNRFGLVDLITRERCIRCHEEVAAWCGYE